MLYRSLIIPECHFDGYRPAVYGVRPVYHTRKVKLPMRPDLGEVTQVLVDTGWPFGRTWLTTGPGDLVERPAKDDVLLYGLRPEQPKPQPAPKPRQMVMPRLEGDPHRDPVFEALRHGR